MASRNSLTPGDMPHPIARAQQLAWVAVVLILTILAITSFFNIKSQQINQQAHRQWHDYNAGVEQKSQLIGQIYQHLGYAGMIHHFKNAVLRRDPSYLQRAKHHLQAAVTAINDYRQVGEPEASEHHALNELENTIQHYATKIEHVRRMIAQGATAAEIDARVKVDDTPATEALNSLRAIWQRQYDETSNTFEHMFHEFLSLSRIANYTLPLYFLFSMIVIAIFMRLIFSLQRSHLQQQQSEQRACAIVNNSTEAIITVNGKGQIETFNPAACHLFGFEAEEAQGQNLSLLIPQRWRERHAEYVRSMARRRKKVIGLIREVEGQRKNGETFPLEISIAPITTGKSIHYMAICRDITQRKMLEQEQRKARKLAEQAQRDAEKASQAKSRFLSQMSHELRTPLNAILGFTQLLRLDPKHPLSHEQKQRITEIERAGQHLLELVDEVLDLAKIEAGQTQLSTRDLSASPLLQECQALISPHLQDNQLSLSLQIEQPSPWLHADPTRLKQVILNLLSNACKYNRQGGNIILSCQSNKSQGMVRIAVTDTGPGIAPDKQAQLFTAFDRLGAEHSNIEGTGIGLVISKQLIEQMHGRLGVINRPGQGCTFWVEVPAGQAHAQAATMTQESPRPQTAKAQK